MKKDTFLWQFWGFAFTTFGGALLHFLYDWTNQSVLAAPFSGVNESTWEHMKLFYFPWLLFALVQSYFYADCPKYWCVKLYGLVTGLFAIPILFYTYNGVIGKSPDWINIAIFFIATALAFYVEKRLFENDTFTCRFPKLSLGIILVFGILFIIFTFATPKIALFLDPVTQTYGITK